MADADLISKYFANLEGSGLRAWWSHEMRAAVGVVAVTAALLCSCSSAVVTADGGTCRIARGDSQSRLLAACGRGCGTGALPEGFCSTKLRDLTNICSNDCEVYGDTALCFSSGELVDVVDLRFPHSGLLSACRFGAAAAR